MSGFKYGWQVHAARWPVNHVQVHKVESQLAQTGFERSPNRIGSEMLVPYLCCNVKGGTRYSGCRDSRAHCFLVLIHFCGIYLAIAEFECALDSGLAFFTNHAECAESQARYRKTLGLNSVKNLSLLVAKILARP